MSVEGSWHSYPKIFAIGHRCIHSIFEEEVSVEEKLDGSQFSFGVFNGELRARSKGAQLNIEAPEKMFGAAIESIKKMMPLLVDGWTYRGEYFQRPKHNTLAYSRIPDNHIMIFDINTGMETYLDNDRRKIECDRIGLECVPVFYKGKVTSPEQFQEFMGTTSILGGQHIEGVVVKNYARFGIDGKCMMGKFVSEAFKEVHQGEWRKQNPTNGDVVDKLIQCYRSPARWQKAIQHLKERGELKEDPSDIGPLFKEISADVIGECAEEIKEKLWDWAWPKIARGITVGFPTWYKEELVKKAFTQDEAA